MSSSTNLDDGALALDVLNDLWVECSLIGKTHLSGEGGGWLPSLGGSWGCLFHHLVDLLKRKTLGLVDKEVSVDDATEAKSSPKEEDLSTKVALVGVDKVWSDDSDDAVPEPVGGSRESNTTRTDWQWEDLTDDNPGTWTPCGGEEEDVDANECNHG